MQLEEPVWGNPGPEVQPVYVLRDDAGDYPGADEVGQGEVRERGPRRRERDPPGERRRAEVLLLPRPDAVGPPEVWDAAGDADPGPGEDDDAAARRGSRVRRRGRRGRRSRREHRRGEEVGLGRGRCSVFEDLGVAQLASEILPVGEGVGVGEAHLDSGGAKGNEMRWPPHIDGSPDEARGLTPEFLCFSFAPLLLLLLLLSHTFLFFFSQRLTQPLFPFLSLPQDGQVPQGTRSCSSSPFGAVSLATRNEKERKIEREKQRSL